MTTWENWAGLATAVPTQVLTPTRTADVVDAVVAGRHHGQQVKMVGSGHSFTAIGAPEGLMLRPDGLTGITRVDRESMTVTALAGTPLHEFNATLERLGLTLHNMGDIDRQTLAGATSTGTHGTGGLVASLAAQICGLELVSGTGEVIVADETQNTDVLAVARLGLGALGVLTSLTFRVQPTFTLEAHEAPMSWDRAVSTFDEMVADNHYTEMYWFPHTDRTLVKRNNRTVDEPAPLSRLRGYVDDELLSNSVFGLINKVGNARPGLIPRLNRITGNALSERTFADVPHKVFTSPRRVRFREMEYGVPRAAGLEALKDVRAVIEHEGWQISFPIEVRVAPADDIPLSTASDRDTMYIACHVNAETDHREYFTTIEDLLRGYDGRPHWGKLHNRTADDLAPAYPRWEEFQAMRDRLDPDRVFTNTYLRTVLGD